MQNLQNLFSLAAISLVACNDYDCPRGEERRGSSCSEVEVDDASVSVGEGKGGSDARTREQLEKDAGARRDADTQRDADSKKDGGSGDRALDTERDGSGNTTPSPQAAPEDAGRGQTEADGGNSTPSEPPRDAGNLVATTDASTAGPTAPTTPTTPACVPSTEVCDGKDNDCDGMIDEVAQTWYCDADGDGFAGGTVGSKDACDKPAASSSCKGWTTRLPSGVDAQDCDDASALRYPGAGFGVSPSSSGDLNCDGKTETRIEFVATTHPQYHPSNTPLNVCAGTVDDVLGGPISGCNCWVSTAVGKGFVGFKDGGAEFSNVPSAGSVPYFMTTFPCAEALTDVVFLLHAYDLTSECTQDTGTVAARQLCR